MHPIFQNYNLLKKPAILCLLPLAILIAGLTTVKAQQRTPVVQLSGKVTSADSTAGLIGIAVYVPGTNRGTITKSDGFFSLPVLAGDSVVFQALGFEKQYILIPETKTPENFTTSIRLKQLDNQLPEVRVIPWITQQDFKVAVRDLKLPDEPTLTPNLGPLPTKYKSIFESPNMNATDNGKQGFKHHMQQQQQRYLVPTQIRIF